MELKNEINRKDAILNKYYDKLSRWSALMATTDPSAGTRMGQSVQSTMMPNQIMEMRMQGPPGSIGVHSMNQQKKMNQMPPNVNQMRGRAPGGPNYVAMSPSPNIQSNQVTFNQSAPSPLAHLERTTCNIGVNENVRR